MKMNKHTWKYLVDNVWNDEVSVDEKESIIKKLTGFRSHFDMGNYVKDLRVQIREELVKRKWVQSLEVVRAK